MVDGLPWREIVGKQVPGAAALQDIENGVEDLAQGMDPQASGGFRAGKWGSMRDHSLSERSVWYAFLMPGILPDRHLGTTFQKVSKA
jgi:hypothetical protein